MKRKERNEGERRKRMKEKEGKELDLGITQNGL